MRKNLGVVGEGWVRLGGTGPCEISARGTGKLYLDLRCDTVLEEPAGLPGARGEIFVCAGGGTECARRS